MYTIEVILKCAGHDLAKIKHGQTTWHVVESYMLGREYQIQFKNNQRTRVAIIVGVDGQDIGNGQTDWRDPWATGQAWVLKPFDASTFTGFISGDQRADAFVFTDPERSRAANVQDGSISAIGTIGYHAWNELVALRAQPKMASNYRGGMKSLGGELESFGGLESAVGTGQGRTQEFRTSSTEFRKGSYIGASTNRYATRAQLEAWGVIRPTYPAIPQVNAFPIKREYAQRPPVNPY